MAEITSRVLRDQYGNPIGGEVDIRNDVWTWGGAAKTSEGMIYVENNSYFKTRVQYDTSTGILGNVSKSTKVGPFTFTGVVNSNGIMTGSAEATFGNSSVIVTPSMATYGYTAPLGPGSITAKLSTDNSWRLEFGATGSGWSRYNFSGGYASSSGYFFNASIFSMGA
ncbi:MULTISPECIES: hypothetical protein [Xanthomonas]|uniref:Uncharacterized protein n=1 Tax=Xanthomonas dyei TaxID=743699 RepID=A0ABZ0D9E7_9XANT|nr:hypothetical protein [Xanthomonas dyei]WOB24649.1 hypothetical protein NYR99_12610 [Xanthomonas dyei]WOB52279.1 hypothetical protein NYR95_12620 [Xanthomonas dyei]